LGLKDEQWAEISPSGGLSVRFIDSHVHISDYKFPRAVIEAAGLADTLLLAASVDRRTSLASLTLSAEAPEVVRGFVGVHPSEAAQEEGLGWLRDAARGAAGVGEIGLDMKYSPDSPMDVQRKVFLEHLQIAEEFGKPVQVHSRGTEEECIATVSRFRLESVLLHWFQGEEALELAEGKGYFVSFGPALLSSKRLQRIARAYDRSLVLVETDGPVPFPTLGGAEGPGLIPSVIFKLTQIYGSGFDEVATLVRDNSLRYLKSEKG